jgi:hypothetical protein
VETEPKKLGAHQARSLTPLPETIVIWACVISATVVSRNGNTAVVSGPLILVICFITIFRALWVRRGLTSKILRHQALGTALVSLSFALIDFFVFMDGLGINPSLNVYFGVGPLGIALPLVSLTAIGYWAYGAILGMLLERGVMQWVVLFFISIVVGLIINSTPYNAGTGLALGVIFGTFCLYEDVRDLKDQISSAKQQQISIA